MDPKRVKTSKERAEERLEAIRKKYAGQVRLLPVKDTTPEMKALERIANLLSMVLGKDAEINVNVPEQKINIQVPEQRQPDPQITVNVPESAITVNVPEQKKPTITVMVPEQRMPAPIVNVKAPDIKFPDAIYPDPARRWNFQINRDDRGLITSINAERAD